MINLDFYVIFFRRYLIFIYLKKLNYCVLNIIFKLDIVIRKYIFCVIIYFFQLCLYGSIYCILVDCRYFCFNWLVVQ